MTRSWEDSIRKQIVGYKDLDGLIRKEHSIAFRITKEEAIDLPEQTFIKRKVQLGKKEKDLYNQIKRSSYRRVIERRQDHGHDRY
ncbi:MAG: hypothetical protein ACLTF6_12275 [Clostridium sp.]